MTTIKNTMRTARPALTLEPLEDRVTPTVGVFANGLLLIDGSAGKDVVKVSSEFIGGAHYCKVTENGSPSYEPTSQGRVFRIVFLGRQDDDFFQNTTNLPCVAYGMEGTDILIGGSNNDLLFGGDARDALFGGLGYDSIFGEGGNDYLDGGHDEVSDYLVGGIGFDTYVRDVVYIGQFLLNRDSPADFTYGQDRYDNGFTF